MTTAKPRFWPKAILAALCVGATVWFATYLLAGWGLPAFGTIGYTIVMSVVGIVIGSAVGVIVGWNRS